MAAFKELRSEGIAMVLPDPGLLTFLVVGCATGSVSSEAAGAGGEAGELSSES
ncbi:MAG: hypothetical protein JJ978_15845 [Roseivirga sp.]|uniref:hypothetical protein n=1 Tax=Roseivirga sp. TaxID=1964215 RepID=UPI001B143B35|nr:hypothetical protein [Roseivirga sp.]MBO6497043.1 hypothetical protein [Roseivirga sp.]